MIIHTMNIVLVTRTNIMHVICEIRDQGTIQQWTPGSCNLLSDISAKQLRSQHMEDQKERRQKDWSSVRDFREAYTEA